MVILFLSCSSFISFSKIERNEKIDSYYQNINKAELSIVNDNFHFATKYFLSAIQINDLFTQDAQNALICSIEIDDYGAANVFSKSLLKKGVPYSYFYKNEFLSNYIGSKEWDMLKREGEHGQVNFLLREKIDSLLTLDQEFRHNYNDDFRDTVLIVDSLIKIEVLNIFENYGYPNDNIVGVEMHNDSTIDFSWNSFDIILIHQIKSNKKQFIPILEEFLDIGKMSRKSFLSHSKNFFPYEKFKLNCFEAVQGLFIQVKDELFTCGPEMEVEIDSNRKKYYLEPISELKLKVDFHYEVDSRFNFKGYCFNYGTGGGEEEFLRIKQELLEKGLILHKKLENSKPYFRRQ